MKINERKLENSNETRHSIPVQVQQQSIMGVLGEKVKLVSVQLVYKRIWAAPVTP